MEILINENSLNGQFESVEDFIKIGLRPFIGVLKTIFENYKTDLESNSLYKSSTFYNTKITSKEDTFNDIWKLDDFYKYEELRKFNSLLEKLYNKDWDDEPMHNIENNYWYNNKNVSCTSLAEAYERDKVIISFHNGGFQCEKISVYRIKIQPQREVKLCNLLKPEDFTNMLNERYTWGNKPFSNYCKDFFSKTKLNFSKIYSKNGFDLLVKESDQKLHFDKFKIFSELSWDEIKEHKGLNYKEYKDIKGYFNENKTIDKFRITEKYRCFGYREGDLFYVLRFDLTHKLSDDG
jgi:hypothetical protein